MDRNQDFLGKVIAVTGGASGIGLATARILHSRGANVAVADINQAALNEASKGIPDGAKSSFLISEVDVADSEAVNAWIAEIVRHFGHLDGAANCAGIIGNCHGTRTVAELENDQWDRIMRVNLTGMMYCLRAQLRFIQPFGSIVCVSSVQGTMGFAKHAAYSTSKHGMIGLVRSAAKEVGRNGVRVNSVAPGSIDTPLQQQRDLPHGEVFRHPETPINRLGTACEVGELISFLLSDQAKFISGANYAIDGSWVSEATMFASQHHLVD